MAATVATCHLRAAAGSASGAVPASLPKESGLLDHASKAFCDAELVGPRVPACVKAAVLTRVFSVPCKDKPGTQALKLEKNPPALRYLLEKGALPMQKGGSGLYPLHHFVSRPSCTAEVVQLLIKAGADVNAVDTCGWPILYYAAACTDNAEVVKALIAAGAKVNAVIAIEEKRIREDLCAARLSGDEIRQLYRMKSTGLINAWPPMKEHNSTALHWAVRFNRSAVVEALLEAGADMNARDFFGRTARDVAAQKKHLLCIQILERYQNCPMNCLSNALEHGLILPPGI